MDAPRLERPRCSVLRSCLLAALLTGCHPRSAPKPGATGTPPILQDSGGPPSATVAAGTAVLTDDALFDAVSGALAVATTRIRLAQYTLWDSGDAAHLLEGVAEAAARGVQVQVLADEEADDTADWLARLTEAGAETALDSPDVTLHTKLWIIDDVVFTGSHNLSHSALSSNREVSARLTEPAAVAAFDAWFDGVWVDSSASPDVPSVEGTTRPVFDRDVLPAVLACIDGAEERVRVGLYAFAWNADYPGGEIDQLLRALVAAADRGIDLRVVLDSSRWIRDNAINDAAIDQLRAGGVDVRRADAGEVVHAKAMVCDDTTLVSDANWSYSGLALYHGASVHIESERLADELATWIDALYDAGSR